MFGLAGTHRSGKTTTAKRVAKELGIEFHDGSFGALAKRLGYESVATMTPAERLVMQERCLALHLEDLKALPRPCVTDRTPLDFAAYAMAEIGMQAGLEPEISERLDASVDTCLAATVRHYGAIALLAPLPTYTPEPGKPAPCRAYQTHVHLIIEGMAFRLRKRANIGVTSTFDLDRRVLQVATLFGDTFMDLDAERSARLVH